MCRSTESFFRDVFFNRLYQHDFPLIPKEWNTICMSDLVKVVSETLMYFDRSFNDDFFPIFKRSENLVGVTNEQFFTYVVARFQKICETHTYFNFMLGCSFLSSLVLYFSRRKVCFRFMAVSHKCITIVFNRGFGQIFQDLGGLEGLRLFCDAQNTIIKQVWGRESFRDILMEETPLSNVEISALIAECEIVHYILLSQSELDLLHNEDFSTIRPVTLPVLNSYESFESEDAYKFRWDIKTAMYVIYLTTEVDFKTEHVFSSTINRVITIQQEPKNAHVGDLFIIALRWILKPALMAKYNPINFYSLIGTVFQPGRIVYAHEHRILFDVECDDRNDELLSKFHDMVNVLATLHAVSREWWQFFPRLMKRTCVWCDQNCYILGMYFFLKHQELCTPPVAPKEEE